VKKVLLKPGEVFLFIGAAGVYLLHAVATRGRGCFIVIDLAIRNGVRSNSKGPNAKAHCRGIDDPSMLMFGSAEMHARRDFLPSRSS
jgi:hypothetical protein